MKRLVIAAPLLLLPLILLAQAPVTVEFVRFTPVAIWGDGLDTSTAEVRVTGPVTAVEISTPANYT